MTTITFDISDSNQPNSRWTVITTDDKGKPRHLGQVNKIAAAQVPDRCHQDLSSPRSNALYVSSKGHWSTTLEKAADLLANTEAPSEFIVTGAILGLFPLSEVPEESQVKPWGDYLVFQDSDGFWSAEELSLALSAS